MNVSLDDFPTARSITYLDSASIALMPEPVINSMLEFERKIAAGGTMSLDEETELRALEDARESAASLLGAHVDEVAILSSATDGICSFALSLDIRDGTNIVSTDVGFPSVVYPWMQLAQKKRLEVRLAKNLSGIVHEEELEKLVDDQTAVVSISHVEYATGQRYDLRWLSELAHSHGALLIVDATQSAGLVPIDVRLDGVDALVASGYKGLLGPFGAAIFYLRREHVRKLAPPLVGWRSTQDPSKLDVRTMSLADSARKFEHSSMSYASAFGLAESIRYLGKTGYRNVTNHVVSLSSRLVDIIKNDHDLPGSTIITPEDESSRAAITSLRFKNKDQSRIVTELARRKIIVAQRLGSIRFSFHVYNTDEDLSRAVQILKEIVTTRQCDRF